MGFHDDFINSVDSGVDNHGGEWLVRPQHVLDRLVHGRHRRIGQPVDQARFTWELGPDGAEALVVGFDVAQRDADGRLALVLGFLDKVPSA